MRVEKEPFCMSAMRRASAGLAGIFYEAKKIVQMLLELEWH